MRLAVLRALPISPHWVQTTFFNPTLPRPPFAASSAPCTRAWNSGVRGLLKPRMLNCLNPSTFLIQPLGGSAIPCACCRPAGLHLCLELAAIAPVRMLLWVDLSVLLAFPAQRHHQRYRRVLEVLPSCGSLHRRLPLQAVTPGCCPHLDRWRQPVGDPAAVLPNSAATLMRGLPFRRLGVVGRGSNPPPARFMMRLSGR